MDLLEPAPLWHWAARQRTRPHVAARLVATALAGGLLVALATEVGVRWFNSDWNTVAGYRVQPDRGWGPFLALWAMATLLPLAQGLFGGWMLPLYGRPRDRLGGLAVGVLGSLPIYATAPALVLLPGVLVVCVAFVVSCAWWGSGARWLLGVPIGESSDHVIASIIAGSVALSVVAALVPMH